MLNELLQAMEKGPRMQITVWDPSDDSVEFNFDTHILEISNLLVMIEPPAENTSAIIPRLQNGYVVGAVLEAYPNPYVFYPVIHAQPSGAKKGYWLRIPNDAKIEVVQRRRHVRIQMDLPIQVEHQPLSEWRCMEARTEDVSGGGMRFTGPLQFAKDEEIRIRLQFTEEGEAMLLKAKVIFSNENRIKRRDNDLYATACQFYDLEDRHEMIIVRECFRRELKQKR